ncbi:MAG TPA: tetratricopeptide repeat protein [Chloroflexota bacterium]|jgi:hypothetical protein|nr:tetratricopeptide repeat protein [Chloroflexota bacterium]
MAWALHQLGLAAHIAGEYPAALAHYEPALAIRQDLGHVEGIGVCFNVMGLHRLPPGRLRHGAGACA